MDHVIMFREVSDFGIGSRNFNVQAVCSCEWESDVHDPSSKERARLQANEHILRFKGFPAAGPRR